MVMVLVVEVVWTSSGTLDPITDISEGWHADTAKWLGDWLVVTGIEKGPHLPKAPAKFKSTNNGLELGETSDDLP